MILSKTQAKALWISAQGLHEKGYFGKGSHATAKVIEHLGYVQIDTISVIERSHHHILYSRIPGYRQEHLHIAQSQDIGPMPCHMFQPKIFDSFKLG